MADHNRYWEDSTFEITRKRRKGFPSETQVKRGQRVVHGDKELREKLGRNDLCPCGSGRSFQDLLYAKRSIRRLAKELLLSANRTARLWRWSCRRPRFTARSAWAVRQHFLRAEWPGLSSVTRTNPRSPNLPADP